MSDVRISTDGHVGIAEICRAPNNFFDIPLIRDLAAAFEGFDADPNIRSIVLCAEGKNFCAGANFASPARDTVGDRQGGHLYQQAVRLFRCERPIVAAVQGAAVGGGLGLAMVADFRVASAESRFTANFNRLGFHPGFGLSVTLKRAIGEQKAALLFYTGRRIGGEEAERIGLVDVLAPAESLREAALALAKEIAVSAPLAVASTRRTLRRGLADAVAAITDHELAEQQQHFQTEDFKEGVAAMAERRPPAFTGR
ncbi:MAG: enoyl-CoA hydratase/isomerase family protein [Acetobacteraceae bacterium]|nr:enoyl-CoA hydratase/isomerase family protein [Acetobacteraceae bacterium]